MGLRSVTEAAQRPQSGRGRLIIIAAVRDRDMEDHPTMTKNVGRVDYVDRYAVDLPEPMDAPRFCSLILEAAPRWLDLLLSMRDSVAGPLGFNTQERNYGKAVSLAPGLKFGPLIVQSVSPQRVVCGDTDKHLAYQATFEIDPVRLRGTFTTEVQFLDALGRAYFALVKPFHKRVIPALISAPFSARASTEPIPRSA